jgi:uncharacterized protein (DUF697 family)
MTTSEATIEGTVVPPESEAEGMADRESQARRLVRYYTGWSAGAGIVPVPIVDMLLVMGVQVQMLRKLSDHYDIPFAEHTAKNLVAALLGGLVPEALTLGAVGQALRAVPGVGPVLGFLTMPTFSAAATWAVGRVFIQHFESGGTFLTFKPEKVRDHFRKEFEAAKADPSLNPAKEFAKSAKGKIA